MRSAHLPAVEGAALRTAFRLLVQAVGGLEAAAAVTGVTPALLARQYAPQEDGWPRIDCVLDLERVAGQPIVTEVLARMTGYTLQPRVAADGACRVAAVASVLDGGAEVASRFAASLADGRITQDESEGIARSVAALARQAAVAAGVLGAGGDEA